MKTLSRSVNWNAYSPAAAEFPPASIAATPVENRPIASHSLEAALKEVTKPVSKAEIRDTFDGLADRPV